MAIIPSAQWMTEPEVDDHFRKLKWPAPYPYVSNLARFPEVLKQGEIRTRADVLQIIKQNPITRAETRKFRYNAALDMKLGYKPKLGGIWICFLFDLPPPHLGTYHVASGVRFFRADIKRIFPNEDASVVSRKRAGSPPKYDWIGADHEMSRIYASGFDGSQTELIDLVRDWFEASHQLTGESSSRKRKGPASPGLTQLKLHVRNFQRSHKFGKKVGK